MLYQLGNITAIAVRNTAGLYLDNQMQLLCYTAMCRTLTEMGVRAWK